LLKEVRNLQGDYNLSCLADWPDDRIRQYLLNIDGVGPKTSACVMAFSLERNVMPVDTHVYRVSQRLGLLPVKTSVAAAHEYYNGFKDSLSLYQLHLNMVAHGRNVCHARKPQCTDCSLKLMCDHYRKNHVLSARNN
jgi:endonuclease-3